MALSDLQNLRLADVIVTPQGTPSTLLMQLLQRRGTSSNTTEERLDAAEVDITALQDDKADKSITLTAGTGLSGGGDLSANRTFDLENTAVTAGSYTSADITVDAQGRITAAANGSGGGGGGGGTSWFNPGGFAGDRRFVMTATATGGYSGDPNQSLDRVPQSSFYWNSGSTAKTLTFDFATACQVEGIAIYQDNNTAQGTWKIEGSDDNATWTTLVASVAMNFTNNVFKTTWTNASDYRYYRLSLISGSTSSSPYVQWFVFKIKGFDGT